MPPFTARPAASAEDVADLLDRVARADHELGEVFDRIAASRAPIHPSTITELERLLDDTLRPAVRARAALAAAPQTLLQSGLLLRQSRRARCDENAR